jgi:hypothetical protein
MKNKLKTIIFITCIAILLCMPLQIFANGGIGTYDHKLSAGQAGENTKIEFWGTGYNGYFKILNLYNDNTSEQIDSILTIDVNEDPWDLEINNILPAGRYYYNIIIADDYDIMNSEVYAIPPILVDETYYFNISAEEVPVETWVRTMPMSCWQIWINEDNNFQFIFWYPYENKNYIRIYDMEDKLVYDGEILHNDPNLIVNLPDGSYTVRTYYDQEMLQEFVIGKP